MTVQRRTVLQHAAVLGATLKEVGYPPLNAASVDAALLAVRIAP
jgi:hypothetical protein